MFFAPFLVLHSISANQTWRPQTGGNKGGTQSAAVQRPKHAASLFTFQNKIQSHGEKNNIDKRRNRRRLEVFTRSNTKQQLKVSKLKQTFQAAPLGGNTISVAVETNTGWTVKTFLCSGTNPGGRPRPADGPKLKPSLASGADLKQTMSGLMPDGLKRHTQPSIQHVGAPGSSPGKNLAHPRHYTTARLPSESTRHVFQHSNIPPPAGDDSSAVSSLHYFLWNQFDDWCKAKTVNTPRGGHTHAHTRTQTHTNTEFFKAIT